MAEEEVEVEVVVVVVEVVEVIHDNLFVPLLEVVAEVWGVGGRDHRKNLDHQAEEVVEEVERKERKVEREVLGWKCHIRLVLLVVLVVKGT